MHIQFRTHNNNCLFAFLSLFFVLHACKTTAQTVRHDELAIDLPTSARLNVNPNPDAVTSLEFQELSALEMQQGMQWKPFVIGHSQSSLVTERDLSFGYFSGRQNTVHAPDKGRCISIGDLAASQEAVTAGVPLAQPEDTLIAVAPEVQRQANGAIFYIINLESGEAELLGAFDEMGQARCNIPFKEYAISTGSSDLRVSTIISDATQKHVTAQFRKRALISIEPNKGFGIVSGDIVRFGRQPTLNADFSDNPLATRWGEKSLSESYTKVSNPSENFGVKEVFQTSFLVGEQNVQIYLEPANYTFAIIRKNVLDLCLQKLELKADDITKLSCSAASEDTSRAQGATPDGEQDVKPIIVDGTFWPKRLLGLEQFRKFLAARGVDFVPIDDDSARDVGAMTSQEKSLVNFLVLSAAPPNVQQPRVFGPFVGLFEQVAEDANSRAQMVRLVSATQRFNFERLAGDFYAKYDNSVLPLGGVSMRGVSNGAVPFLVNSFFRLPRGQSFSPLQADYYASNGAIIRWNEPRLTDGSQSFPVRPPLQKRFRGAVLIPPWNNTQFVDFYVNAKLYRRWVVVRPDLSQPYTFTFDERIDEKTDFDVSLVAWGNAYLPEFIVGAKNLTPSAMSRQICIDVNENGQCESQR